MTDYGFWRQNRQTNQQAMLSTFGQINKVWYLFPQGTGPSNNAPSMNCFTTFAALAPNLRSRDLIILSGVLREQAVAPLDVYDVTIVGAANQPRQATSSGTPTGGGACWIPPTSPVATTPLLELRAAGWTILNVEFTPVNASAAIRLTRSASVDTIDASHTRIAGCYFAANGGTTQIGIEDNGGCRSVVIDDCLFESLGGTAIKGLSTAAAVPLMWQIINNRFNRNTNAIGMSATQALVANNVFNQAANDTNFKINLIAVAAQGSLNMVLNNVFSDVAANVTIAKGYKPGTTDVWRNYVTDTAAYIVTVPA